MSTRALIALAFVASGAGCFSPSVDADPDESGGGATGSSSGGTTAEPTGDQTGQGGSTSADPTENPSGGDPTSAGPTGDDSTGDATDPTEGGSTAGDPFCGDGNVDPGEECDDGLENNGLEQSCLPDCNLNVCGDGNLGPDEFCDDGEDDNLFEVGACAPDCSVLVEERVITLGDAVEDGDLGNNPVATADGTCPVGYQALFAHGNVRRATTEAYDVVDPIDWVLRPWTFYVRSSGELVWATDSVALLGVRDGAAQSLDNSVGTFAFGGTEMQVLTGLEGDWTSALSSTCDGWSTTDASVRPGDPLETSSPSFLREGQATSCAELSNCPGAPQPCVSLTYFYCVEQ